MIEKPEEEFDGDEDDAITDADDNAAAPAVVVISHQYWQERFGAKTDVVGRQIKLNQTPFTIVGVTPPAFIGALQVSERPAVTVPLAFEPVLRQRADSHRFLRLRGFARGRSGRLHHTLGHHP